MGFFDSSKNGNSNKEFKRPGMQDIIDDGLRHGLELSNPLLRKVYLLGFEVGFYRHQEFVDWISIQKETLYSLCLSEGLENEFYKIYETGKKIGAQRDDRPIPNMIEDITQKQSDEKIIIISREERENSTLLDKPDQLNHPQITYKPDMIEAPKKVQPPPMLRGFGKSKKKKAS